MGIILEWILKNPGGRSRTGRFRHRVGTSGGFFEHGDELSGSGSIIYVGFLD
jgi:hypothetical protein